jgi:hypothetical protein
VSALRRRSAAALALPVLLLAAASGNTIDVPAQRPVYTVEVGTNPNGISLSPTSATRADHGAMPLQQRHSTAHPGDDAHGH